MNESFNDWESHVSELITNWAIYNKYYDDNDETLISTELVDETLYSTSQHK